MKTKETTDWQVLFSNRSNRAIMKRFATGAYSTSAVTKAFAHTAYAGEFRRHVMVEGRLKLNSWQTDEGVKRNKLTVVAENVNLTPNGGNKNGSQQTVSAGAGAGADEDTPF